MFYLIRKKEIDELVMALISESQESQDNDESSDEEEVYFKCIYIYSLEVL